jgi:hypothetical protein
MASAGAVVTAGGCECSASECFATPRGRCSPAVSGPPFPSRSSPEILWLGAWAARHATVLEPTSVVLTFVVGCGLVLCDAVLFTAALAACSVGRQRAHHGGSVVSHGGTPLGSNARGPLSASSAVAVSSSTSCKRIAATHASADSAHPVNDASVGTIGGLVGGRGAPRCCCCCRRLPGTGWCRCSPALPVGSDFAQGIASSASAVSGKKRCSCS